MAQRRQLSGLVRIGFRAVNLLCAVRLRFQGPPTRDEFTWKSAGIGTDIVRYDNCT